MCCDWPDFLFECMKCGEISSWYNCDDAECFYHLQNPWIEDTHIWLINITSFDDWF